MNASSIDVRDLTKKFGAFTAVDHISFDVRKGRNLRLPRARTERENRRPSGCCAASSGRPRDSGLVGGFDVGSQPEEIKKIIGYMSQKFTLYGDLTVAENIDFYGGIHGLPQALKKERKSWVLTMAGLQGREHSLTRELSGGWKQRLALGCAILHQPEILFLDEPTASVDPSSRRDFWDLIYDLSEQGTTHSRDLALYGRSRTLPQDRHHFRRKDHRPRLAPRAQNPLSRAGKHLRSRTFSSRPSRRRKGHDEAHPSDRPAKKSSISGATPAAFTWRSGCRSSFSFSSAMRSPSTSATFRWGSSTWIIPSLSRDFISRVRTSEYFDLLHLSGDYGEAEDLLDKGRVKVIARHFPGISPGTGARLSFADPAARRRKQQQHGPRRPRLYVETDSKFASEISSEQMGRQAGAAPVVSVHRPESPGLVQPRAPQREFHRPGSYRRGHDGHDDDVDVPDGGPGMGKRNDGATHGRARPSGRNHDRQSSSPILSWGSPRWLWSFSSARSFSTCPSRETFFACLRSRAIFLLCGLGIGLFLSIAVKSQQLAFMFSVLTTLLPSYILSGFMFPISSMPKIIQLVTVVVPARYFLATLRGIFLKGYSFPDIWVELLALAAFGLLMLLACVKKLKLRLD